MERPSKERLFQAAELRAGGCKRSDIAAKVGCTEAELIRWMQDYPHDWAKALEEAEHRTIGEAAAEAVLRLRTMLRSTDDATAGLAARSLNSLLVELRKLALREPESPAPPSSESARLVAFLEGQPDEHLHRLVRAFFPDADARLEAGAVSTPASGTN